MSQFYLYKSNVAQSYSQYIYRSLSTETSRPETMSINLDNSILKSVIQK